MKIENNNYIPVRNFSIHPITNDEKEIIKEINEKLNKQLVLLDKMYENTNKQIDLLNEQLVLLNEQRDLLNQMTKIIERSIDYLSTAIKKAKEANLSKDSESCSYVYSSSINHQKNNDKSIVNSVDTKDNFLVFKDYLRNNFNTEQNPEMSESKFKDFLRKVYEDNQKFMLYTADFCLTNGNHKKAINMYNLVLSNKFKYESEEQLDDCYIPIEEELRQASKLYVSLQPMIDKLNLDENIRIDLFSSAIAAHTQGKFSLSKIEVLDMINKQFYYA